MGVSRTPSNKWRVRFHLQGVRYDVGIFETEEQAEYALKVAMQNPWKYLPDEKQKRLQEARDRSDETLAEIEREENYKPFFKYRCFRCFMPINTVPYWKHYKQQGNFCLKCSSAINEIIKRY